MIRCQTLLDPPGNCRVGLRLLHQGQPAEVLWRWSDDVFTVGPPKDWLDYAVQQLQRQLQRWLP